MCVFFFFFKQKTAYEMRISDCSSDVCSSDRPVPLPLIPLAGGCMGLLFGIILGAVSTRRAGTVFAMITLGLAELISSMSLILRGFFGGEEGISANRRSEEHTSELQSLMRN